MRVMLVLDHPHTLTPAENVPHQRQRMIDDSEQHFAALDPVRLPVG